jgi:hypothetical protein
VRWAWGTIPRCLLTPIHVDGRWQVISKVFHYDVSN